MSKNNRSPYPPLGYVVELWHKDGWFADIVAERLLVGGDVLVRLLRSAEPSCDGYVGRAVIAAKILRSGSWILRGIREGRGPKSKVQIPDESWIPSSIFKQRLAEKRAEDKKRDDLPVYCGNDERGKAVLEVSIAKLTPHQQRRGWSA